MSGAGQLQAVRAVVEALRRAARAERRRHIGAVVGSALIGGPLAVAGLLALGVAALGSGPVAPRVIGVEAPSANESVDVSIKGAAVEVLVIPEPRSDVTAEVRVRAGGLPAPTLQRVRGVLVVDGGLATGGWRPPWAQAVRCRGSGVEVRGRLLAPPRLPLVIVRTPAKARISSEGAVFGRVGPSDSLVLQVSGCGRWRADPVRTDLTVRTAGEADVGVANLNGRLMIRAVGSGGVSVGGGDAPTAYIENEGTGAVRFDGSVGRLFVRGTGAGEVRLGEVRALADVVVPGKGRVSYSQPNGRRFCLGCDPRGRVHN